MNVLFLSEVFYPHGGGAELATYLYAKLLSEAKFNVTVVTNRFPSEPEFSKNEGFTVYRLPLLKRREGIKYSILQRFDVLFSSFMRRWIKWADVVYVPRFWFSAIPLAKALGKPVIVHLHDYIPVCPLTVLYDSRVDGVCQKGGFCSVGCIGCVYAYESGRRKGLSRALGSTFLNLTVWPVLRGFIECSDAVVCVSRAQRDLLVRYAPSLGGKIKVIYDPLPQLSPVPIDGDDFGYFGGSSYLKGFHVLLKALKYRKLRGLDPVTVHAAKFSGIDPRFAGFLEELGFVLYGKLGSNEMDQIYRNVKAVIMPSILGETFGYVVAEALLRGRIVIASRIGGIPEAVEGCKGAFLLDAGDAAQLAETISVVKGLSREEVKELGKQNKEAFVSRFENQMTLKDFSKLCNSVTKTW
ncbi:MAG: glycosyltransferase family 4 protein [Candidatus Bathyarchaeia archaeon]|jgi:glycosyltransferase involved in cell wall biosynthesis|nr:glycosyltransferase family 4 protein [Candidatus Bathyarchaeota archaeon A05DMB-4]